jgi:hypothetical protein
MLRNGLSDAQETGAADDSYDLSWMHGMPEDSIRAIPVLRELLAKEQDILSRHYMYAQLERLLYRSRNALASALAEYDQDCHQHDAEMHAIRGTTAGRRYGGPSAASPCTVTKARAQKPSRICADAPQNYRAKLMTAGNGAILTFRFPAGSRARATTRPARPRRSIRCSWPLRRAAKLRRGRPTPQHAWPAADREISLKVGNRAL